MASLPSSGLKLRDRLSKRNHRASQLTGAIETDALQMAEVALEVIGRFDEFGYAVGEMLQLRVDFAVSESDIGFDAGGGPVSLEQLGDAVDGADRVDGFSWNDRQGSPIADCGVTLVVSQCSTDEGNVRFGAGAGQRRAAVVESSC